MATIKRVLISVSDKSGIVEFATALQSLGAEILSTGGTARLLSESGLAVTEVSDYTGFPEMMDGRLKTLHPKIHGGLLGRRGQDDQVMADNGIKPIDMVVVNLYPFQETIAKEGCTLENAIENIDIGGPTMLRAAAKNHRDVTVVVDPTDFQPLIEEMQNNQGAVSSETNFRLAVKTFDHTAGYDGAISNYLSSLNTEGETATFPDTLNMQLQQTQVMRYGENPHQQAAFFIEEKPPEGSISSAKQLHGKALSYNNIADSDAALECVKMFSDSPACVIVKHANPCGVATGSSLEDAYQRAYATDPTSAFGGIIAFNQVLDGATAKAIAAQQFVEVVLAPAISPEAMAEFAKKENVRLLETGHWSQQSNNRWDYKRVNGGLLVQDQDLATVTESDLKIVSSRAPSPQEISDLLMSWKVVKHVKSNAIVYVKDSQTVGIGAGQMSRVFSSIIAGLKADDANLEVPGSVMASDAFFPFRDSIDAAAKAGIRAIIQPGGSIRDQEVIDAANEHDIAMVFTGIRHFRH